MAEHTRAGEILEAQGGILVELDRSKTFRVSEDGLLHFRVRNLTKHVGRLALRIQISRVDLLRNEVAIDLQPNRVHDLRFPLCSSVPGEKLVERMDVDFVLGGQRHQLTLPDHGVTLYMAPDSTGSGEIDLSGVSFDFRDHVGDVVVRNVIAEQDKEQPARPQEQWCGLALIPRPSGRIVAQAPRKQGLTDLLFLGPRKASGGRQVRVFLFARKKLRFGSKGRKEEKDVPLILRRLPAVSRREHATNFFLNELVSGWHGTFDLVKGKLCLCDEGSLNGTSLNRVVLPKRAWVALPTSFRLQLTAETDVLSLTGRIFRPVETPQALTLREPPEGGLLPEGEIGSERIFPVDAMRLRRRGNAEEHVYVQVLSHVLLGSAADCALRFRGEGIFPRHARISFYRGEWLLNALSEEGITMVDGRPVGTDEHVTLAPGKSVVIGSLEFRLRSGKKELMTTL